MPDTNRLIDHAWRRFGAAGATRRAPRRQRALLALGILLLALYVGASPPPALGSGPATPTGMPPSPVGLPQSWVASFHLSGHLFHPGDHITGTITVLAKRCQLLAPPCYLGTDWSVAGGRCPKTALTCTWIAGDGSPTPQWSILSMPINNEVGPAASDDYFAIVDKSVHILDGHVLDNAGNPIAHVRLDVSGTQSASVTTDKLGYYSVFLHKGTYTVSPGGGSPAAARYFHPQFRPVTLGSHATADFEGDIHTVTTLSKTTVSNSGLETAVLTVRAEDPLGQPVPGHVLHVDVVPTGGNAAAVVCSAMPNFTGRIAPAGLAGGAPYYVPVNQPTDPTGTLTYQVYFGAEPGRMLFSADDPAVTKHGGAGNVSSFSSVEATVSSAASAPAFPVLYTVRLHRATGTRVDHLLLGGAMAAVVQGLTADLKANQLVPSPVNLGGASGDAQKALLRAIEGSETFDGFALSPIMGAGGMHPGVLIYLRSGSPSGRSTVVLDLDTARALQADTLHHAELAVHLPTRADWERNIVGGASVLDYASAEPEQGLTYVAGLPYLPVSDADLATFDGTCVNRAPSL